MTSCLWPFNQTEKLSQPGSEGPNFPYSEIGNRYFPLVDIAIHSNFRIFKVRALVDSGASLSLFRPELATYLGLKIEKGRRIVLESITTQITGYIHELHAEITGKKFKLPIAFLATPHTSFNILGREGFFNQFIITFNEDKKILKLK